MDRLVLEASRNTPEILLDPGGNIRIRGRSIHENVIAFYQPALDWAGEYVDNAAESTCVDVQLEYFNSASAKYLIMMLQILKKVRLHDKKFFVNWIYEEGDEDILERGEYIASVLDMEFNFIELT
jgi:hypothetical protein